jgi:hypothetical protein
MVRYLHNFKRGGWGVWTCIDNVSLDLPEGPIDVPAGMCLIVGSKHCGVDIAILLEAEHAKATRPN